MALRLYNSLTKQEEDFLPAHGKSVTMYTCGPTVYGRPHIGNYSSFLMADLLRRWLYVGHGYAVQQVKNITDVGHLVADGDSGEDKVEKEALRIAKEKRGKEAIVTHEDVIAVAEMYTQQYLADERKLGFLEPFARPKASEYVEQMKVMISSLLADGHAYVTDDGIYFDVTSSLHTPYGALSGNKLDELNAGARVDVNEGKKHPADFALWKFCVGHNKHHVLRWPSPVMPNSAPLSSRAEPRDGCDEGFPGWHIECSAMSRALLGDTIDIHTGGEDNIFPHHECEIAQTEQVTKKPFVRLWLHKRRIQMGDQKMSKSLGNVLSLDDIQGMGYDPMDLRYYLLSVHYRTQLRFTEEGLALARKERQKITEWFADIRQRTEAAGLSYAACAEKRVSCEATEKFCEAMDSDLNVSDARAVIFGGMTPYNKFVGEGGELSHAQLEQLVAFAEIVTQTFGCFATESGEIPAQVLELLDQRKRVREAKNFAESDRLRDAIAALGYDVKDTKDGQSLQRR